MTSDVGAARIAASWAAIDHLARFGDGATVAELAAAAGISQRTFYRYFPAREDVLRPAMRDSQDAMAAILAAQDPRVSLGDAFAAAFEASAEGEFFERTRGLLPVVLDNATYGAVWSQELRRHQPAFLTAAAARLGTGTDTEAELAATLLLTLMEHALITMVRTSEHPGAALRTLLRLTDSALLARSIPDSDRRNR